MQNHHLIPQAVYQGSQFLQQLASHGRYQQQSASNISELSTDLHNDFPYAHQVYNHFVHAERLVHKLETFTDQQRAAQQQVRGLIWWLYADLKAYRHDPTPCRRAELAARFDRILGVR